jgi:1-pyrroline-5-carboxylate dehydrogenase
MGALFMGNKVCLKPAEKVGFVMELFLRLLHDCGLPKSDVDLLNSVGPVAGELLKLADVRVTQFTGSSTVGELLSEQTRGKVKLEDAGFDWKILGPDVGDQEYVAWQSDQDAYACTGQKCSAQSMLFAHDNWVENGLLDDLSKIAKTRKLSDLTVGPVMTHTTEDFLAHVEKCASIEGARILFGGKELSGHSIPDCYGAVEPTAVFVPLDQLLKDENFDVVCKEIFGPFQVVTSYSSSTLPSVLSACERMSHHLTAAVVSNDPSFQQRVLGSTVNGTTYVGRRARTTGAPQNHWFGPAGDPRGAGIGSVEAIQMVWSCHREIIHDNKVEEGWTKPKAT